MPKMPSLSLPFEWNAAPGAALSPLLSGDLFSGRGNRARDEDEASIFALQGRPLLYGGIALGVLAGAAFSTYLWRHRARTLELLRASPLERAEQIISSCEDKLEAIENAIEELRPFNGQAER